jgi:hypothetical protein
MREGTRGEEIMNRLIVAGLAASALFTASQITSAASLTLPVIDESHHAIVFGINANYNAASDLLSVWGNLNGVVNGDANVQNVPGVRPLDLDLSTFSFIPTGTFKMDVHVDENGVIVPGTQHLELTYFDTSDVQHTLVSSNALTGIGFDLLTQPQIQLSFAQSPAEAYGANVGVLLYFSTVIDAADFSADFNTSDLKADVFQTVPTPASWTGGMALMGIMGLVGMKRRARVARTI